LGLSVFEILSCLTQTLLTSGGLSASSLVAQATGTLEQSLHRTFNYVHSAYAGNSQKHSSDSITLALLPHTLAHPHSSSSCSSGARPDDTNATRPIDASHTGCATSLVESHSSTLLDPVESVLLPLPCESKVDLPLFGRTAHDVSEAKPCLHLGWHSASRRPGRNRKQKTQNKNRRPPLHSGGGEVHISMSVNSDVMIHRTQTSTSTLGSHLVRHAKQQRCKASTPGSAVSTVL